MDNYLGELRVFAFGKIPKGWMPCNGQSLPIAQYQPLFSLLRTTFGGNGTTHFNLPDLRGRTTLHPGSPPYAPQEAIQLGQAGGTENVTLTRNNMPAHTHSFRVKTGVGTAQLAPSTPGTHYLASSPEVPQIFTENIQSFTNDLSGGSTTLHAASILDKGGSQQHENRMPYLTMLICIALTGIFPSRD
ncbi:MAG: tail fiber protein [Chitinophagaceae bacterium]